MLIQLKILKSTLINYIILDTNIKKETWLLVFMDECVKCGISGEVTRLFDAISNEGIVKFCNNCLSGEHIPVLRRPTTLQLKDAEKKPGNTREMLSQMQEQHPIHIKTKKELLERQETTLRDIVERNFESSLPGSQKPRPDLIHNFHWVIMRARRARKVTQKQLAEEIAESEIAIKMAEKGTLPEDDNKIIEKLENYLRINIRKKVPKKEELPKKNLSFDKSTTENLTISDLQEMEKPVEEEILKNDDEPEFIEEDIIEEKNDDDLSDSDMNDLIFGRG